MSASPRAACTAASSVSDPVPPALDKRSTHSAAYPSVASRPTRSKKCGVSPRFSCTTSTAPFGAAGIATAACSAPTGESNVTGSAVTGAPRVVGVVLELPVESAPLESDPSVAGVLSLDELDDSPPSSSPPQAARMVVALVRPRPSNPSRRSASRRDTSPSA